MNLRLIRREPAADEPEEAIDFGLGDQVARQAGTRLINNDGTFNVIRRGHKTFSPYQDLVEMSWGKFLSLTLATYVVVNMVFAAGFLIIGTDGLTSIDPTWPFWHRSLAAFFFSVQTFTTVGYGGMSPDGIATSLLASFVALFGWIALAIVTGVLYARFARPRRRVRFSQNALIADYRDGIESLQFRIVNIRDSQLINVSARVILTWLENNTRRFAPLELERDVVALFPLNWTVVHPIQADSPIYGWTKDDYRRRRSELLITIDGYDQTYAQNIHVQNSYIYDEIIWNATFEPMYFEKEATTELHLDKLNKVKKD